MEGTHSHKTLTSVDKHSAVTLCCCGDVFHPQPH